MTCSDGPIFNEYKRVPKATKSNTLLGNTENFRLKFSLISLSSKQNQQKVGNPNSNIALTDSSTVWVGAKKGVFETFFLLRKTCPNVPVIAPQKAALQQFPWSMPNTNKAAQ